MASIEALIADWNEQDDTVIGSRQMKGTVLAALVLSQVAVGDVDAAAKTLVLAAEQGRASDDMPVVSQIAVASACLAEGSGDADLAARRMGAADSIRGTADAMNRDSRRLIAQLREQLGDEAYERAYAEGLALERDEALALTLGPA